MMKEILALCLVFYAAPDKSSSRITFISNLPKTVVIKSSNISNSIDPLAKPKTYTLTIPPNNFSPSDSAEAECREVGHNKVYRLPWSNFFLHIIELQHEHNVYGTFVNLTGKRELWIDNKKIGEHTFEPRTIETPHIQTLEKNNYVTSKEGYLVLSLGQEGFSGTVHDQNFNTSPSTQYHLSFYYLVPESPSSPDCLITMTEIDNDNYYYRPTKRREYELKDRSARWKRFEKYITVGPTTTTIKIAFKVLNDDNVGDLVVRDFELRKCKVKKGP